jgi:hypothetical protein
MLSGTSYVVKSTIMLLCRIKRGRSIFLHRTITDRLLPARDVLQSGIHPQTALKNNSYYTPFGVPLSTLFVAIGLKTFNIRMLKLAKEW